MEHCSVGCCAAQTINEWSLTTGPQRAHPCHTVSVLHASYRTSSIAEVELYLPDFVNLARFVHLAFVCFYNRNSYKHWLQQLQPAPEAAVYLEHVAAGAFIIYTSFEMWNNKMRFCVCAVILLTFCVSSFFSCFRMSVRLMSFSMASTCLLRCLRYMPQALQ